MTDNDDLKSSGGQPPCGFDPHRRYLVCADSSGHRVSARIAEKYLNSKAKAAVAALLSEGGDDRRRLGLDLRGEASRMLDLSD